MNEFKIVKKTFVYQLNDKGVNRVYFNVQSGHENDGTRTSEEECAKVAKMSAAAPELLKALMSLEEEIQRMKQLDQRFFDEVDETVIDKARATIIKVKGEI